MDAQERVLMTLRHEEPDRVPAFEIVVTNNTIWRHFGVNPSANLGDALKSLRFIPFRHKLMWNALGNRKFIAAGLRAGAKFYQAAGLDLSLSNTAPFPRKLLKGDSSSTNAAGTCASNMLQTGVKSWVTWRAASKVLKTMKAGSCQTPRGRGA